MGIQINGINDIISAADGSFTISGADLSNLPNLNVSGVATVTTLSVTNSNPVNLNVSGIATVSAGSTSAPSISPSGDSNTGIFFPSADTIAFAEGGVEALRIDSSSRLGIGTNNPASATKVEVWGSSTVFRISGHTGSSSRLDLSSAGAVKWSLLSNDSAVSGALQILRDDVNALTINTLRFVGINTTIATSALEVKGDARIVGVLTATSDIKIGSNTVATTGKAIAMAMVFS